jgi:hypothetical protein
MLMALRRGRAGAWSRREWIVELLRMLQRKALRSPDRAMRSTAAFVILILRRFSAFAAVHHSDGAAMRSGYLTEGGFQYGP